MVSSLESMSKVTVWRPVQLRNAWSPMKVTLAGMPIEVRLVQPSNA